jgi:hypothetical protein
VELDQVAHSPTRTGVPVDVPAAPSFEEIDVAEAARSDRACLAYVKPSGERVFENNSSTASFAGSDRRARLR